MGGIEITDMGEAGLLLSAGDRLDIDLQARIWRLAGAASGWAGVARTIPGVNNLLVVFDPDLAEAEDLAARLAAGWDDPPRLAQAPRHHRVAVRYGGADGPDLEAAARACGLAPADYAARHAAARYVVMTVGAYPGFGFLGGLPEALAVSRKAAPRAGVPAGAVMVGGVQTAVMTTTSPSGWHVIGRTDARLLDWTAARPAALTPGDTVGFEVEAGP
jgi:KipI family sensor histidine kinase inhibitor